MLKKCSRACCSIKGWSIELNVGRVWGSITQWIAYLLLNPAAPGLNSPSQVFSGKTLDVAELIDSSVLLGERVDSTKVDQTHPVLARGKLVLQKKLEGFRGGTSITFQSPGRAQARENSLFEPVENSMICPQARLELELITK